MENVLADIPTEGKPFEGIAEKETLPESQPDNKPVKKEPARQGEDKPEVKSEDKTDDKTEGKENTDENLPFHKHPRFKKIIEENRALKEAMEELKSFKTEVNEKLTERKATTIPEWFTKLYGDNDEAWQAYSEQDKSLRQQMKKEILDEIKQEESKFSKEAESVNSWIEEELQEMRDEGLKFDKNELIKVVNDYRPINDEGKWDFRRAYKILQLNAKAPDKARKELADITTKQKPDSKVEKFQTAHTLRNKSIEDFIN